MQEKFEKVFQEAGLVSAEVEIIDSRDPLISEFLLNDTPGFLLSIFVASNEMPTVSQIMTMAGAKLYRKSIDQETRKDVLFYFVKRS